MEHDLEGIHFDQHYAENKCGRKLFPTKETKRNKGMDDPKTRLGKDSVG